MEKSFKNIFKTLKGVKSNEEFGLKCGLSEGTVRSYITGKSDPTLGKLLQIAQACGVTVAWLIGEIEEKETGAGQMLNDVEQCATDQPAALQPRSSHTDKEFDRMKRELERADKLILSQEKTIAMLEEKVAVLEAGLAEPVKKKQQL